MRLIAYHGFLQNKKIFVSGRLVYGRLRKPKSTDTVFQNVIDMLKRYFAIGVPRKKIEIKFGSQVKTVKTKKNGSFTTYLNNDEKEGINSYSARYKDNRMNSRIFFARDERLAIITDIDDTFLVSHSVSFFKRIWVAASNNFTTRNPVEDIINIYKKFSGPIFYVSNSEWRLYDALDGFRKIHNLPLGPFLLRGKSKYSRIKSLIQSYPYNFILIGDDSQKDPEYYSRIKKDFPSRIKAICIRHISSRKRYEEVKRILPKDISLVSPDGNECLKFVKDRISKHEN